MLRSNFIVIEFCFMDVNTESCGVNESELIIFPSLRALKFKNQC